MNRDENIIAIHNRSIDEANKAFADFMRKTEDCFNEKSRRNPVLYKNCSPSELERITERILKEVCPSTPFRESDICLVAGHTFPDIVTSNMYGVEVKSTNKDKWTSTGSSIVESTRSEDIERIYMLFGSLGSTPPAFKCRPYQDCLKDIAVTHSPRYLIDMTLTDKDNIFNKMATDYDTFRLMAENEKISRVRRYYIQKAKKENKVEMPWWMGETANVNISIFSDLPTSVKEELKTRTYILFPSIFSRNSSIGYKEIALWLCNHYSVVCHNMRDSFTAGGKMTMLNGKRLNTPYPQIVRRLLENQERIKALLKHPDKDLLMDIRDYWDFPYDEKYLYLSWLNIIENTFLNNPELMMIDIKELIESGAVPY